jgi:general secretion pathway protein B
VSLILDALKKAEAERQRQTGPTLLEVRVTQPPRRLPLWTLVIGGLLAVNMILLIVFALRRPSAPPVQASGAITAATPVSAAVVSSPAAAPAGAVPTMPTPAVAAPAIAAAAGPPVLAPPVPALASGASGAGPDAEQNPADDEPAVAAGRGSVRIERNERSERNGDERQAESTAALPNFSDLGGELPQLRLDLHVFADRPASRYALINMHMVHEGDVLPEGPTVVEIYRDGVELSYRGTQFMLRPQ